MKAYWIALYKSIDSQENIKKYAKEVTEVLRSYGAKPIVRGGKFLTLEGKKYPRTVIWEFPSYEAAKNCYNSSDYQSAWSLAKQTTERNLQVVEGFNIE